MLRNQIHGLLAAIRFLTILPIPGPPATTAGLGHALPFFPLVGLTLGAMLLAIDRLLDPWLARPLLDVVLLGGLIVLSGGLHFDGLVDTADGLFAPGPPDRRLAIMRESWAGQRGAAAALGQLLLQYAALASLTEATRPTALLLAPMLGRWAIVYSYVAFPYARRTAGLSLALKQGATPAAGLAATLIVLVATSLLFWPSGLWLLAAAWTVATVVGGLTLRRLGGMSGDVYGAVEQVVETLTLIVVPSLMILRT